MAQSDRDQFDISVDSLRFVHRILSAALEISNNVAADAPEQARAIAAIPVVKAMRQAVRNTPMDASPSDLKRFELDLLNAWKDLEKQGIRTFGVSFEPLVQLIADRMVGDPGGMLKEWRQTETPPFDLEIASPLLALLEDFQTQSELRHQFEMLLTTAGNPFTETRKRASKQAISSQARKAAAGRQSPMKTIKEQIRVEYMTRRQAVRGKRINKEEFARDMAKLHTDVKSLQTLTRWCREWDKSFDTPSQ